MEKTEKQTPFDPGNGVSDASVTAGGQDAGNKDGGFATGSSRTTPDGVNAVWNGTAKGPKEFVDGKNHN